MEQMLHQRTLTVRNSMFWAVVETYFPADMIITIKYSQGITYSLIFC